MQRKNCKEKDVIIEFLLTFMIIPINTENNEKLLARRLYLGGGGLAGGSEERLFSEVWSFVFISILCTSLLLSRVESLKGSLIVEIISSVK